MHRSEAKIVTQVHLQPLKPSIHCGHTSKVHSLFKDLVFPGPNHCAHSFSDPLFPVHPITPHPMILWGPAPSRIPRRPPLGVSARRACAPRSW